MTIQKNNTKYRNTKKNRFINPRDFFNIFKMEDNSLPSSDILHIIWGVQRVKASITASLSSSVVIGDNIVGQQFPLWIPTGNCHMLRGLGFEMAKGSWQHRRPAANPSFREHVIEISAYCNGIMCRYSTLLKPAFFLDS